MSGIRTWDLWASYAARHIWTIRVSRVSHRVLTSVDASVAASSVARGYVFRLVANGLSRPRKIHFDDEGHLLVVDTGVGVRALTKKTRAVDASRKTCLSGRL